VKTLFYGTPAFAVPFLELLFRKTSVVGVLSQPDKPVGRSLRIRPTPVKARALELGLPVLQPDRPATAIDEFRPLKPDLAVAVAYGKLLPEALLRLPAIGSVNVHFSLLPKYRGAAPVQWCLARGETLTGVTVFWIEAELDAGPICLQRELAIAPNEDAAALLPRLAGLGLEVLGQVLEDAAAGRARREPQKGEPSFAPRLRREDARLNLELPAREVHDRVRGFRLWPTAFLEFKPPAPRLVRVLQTRLPGPEEPAGAGSEPGRIVRVERGGGILVQCLRSSLWLLTVQSEGKKPVAAADFLNGLRLNVGDFLPLA